MSSDSEDEDDYAFYGTGLDPIEEDAVPKKKPFSLENQVVKDKHGKRRFHGAFTGGFTAGFCNTVGSSEGWTPSAFKSSRSEKASLQTQKPEDFMDDEDFGEFGIAPRVLKATSDYTEPKPYRKRGYIQPSDGPIPGQPVMFDLLKLTRETIGVRLLRQMGWKPGQGVGPRLSRKEKRQQQQDICATKTKIYGCSLPNEKALNHGTSDGEESNTEDFDEELSTITFAPDDYDPYLVKPKTDRFGIGYSGLDKRPVLSGHINLFEPSFLWMQEKKGKVAVSGQAFGVGALEEDDEDIYAKEDMSQYDFALETSASIATRKREEREAEKKRMYSRGSRGEALEGFVPAKRPLESQRKFFPPPEIPNDFTPHHLPRQTRFEGGQASQTNEKEPSRRQGLQRHELNASSRADILGEPVQRPVQKPVSTFEAAQPVVPNRPALTSQLTAEAVVPQIKTEPFAPAALGSSTFRPFAQNPEKQSRYEQFLDLSKRGLKDSFRATQPNSMTEWEKEQERCEFEQAARLYKPLDSFMSDRFVSASQPDDTLNPLAAVEKSQHGNEDMRAAAKLKMFGKLTRKITSWNPCALLCKRFNVPQPAVSLVPEPKSKSRFSVFDYLSASTHNTAPVLSAPNSTRGSTDRESNDFLNNEIKTEPSEETAEEVVNATTARTPTPPPPKPKSRWDCPYKVSSKEGASSSTAKPSKPDLVDVDFPEPPVKADLFKAIFLSSSSEGEDSSDSDSKEENEDAANVEKNQSITTPTVKSTSAKSLVRNMSPPRGIFANLDLDAINTKRSTKISEPLVKETPKSCDQDDQRPDDDELMYGPKLPTNNPPSSRTSSTTTPVYSGPSKGEWVEKKEIKEKHHKHSKHKKQKKHKKHKSKNKHKRRS